jgi:hypothetical protein
MQELGRLAATMGGAMFYGALLLIGEIRTNGAHEVSWRPGPLPLVIPDGSGRVTDAGRRSTYYDRRAAQALYGTGDGCTRKHVEFSEPTELAGTIRLIAAESISVPSLGVDGLLVLHFDAVPGSAAREVLASWGAISRWKRVPSGPELISGALRKALHGAEVDLSDPSGDPYRICFLSEAPDGDAAMSSAATESRTLDDWLLALAIGSAEAAQDLSDHEREQLLATRLRLSADWSALVLRDGAGFLGHPRTSSDFVLTFAPIYLRSIYVDALLLGRLQQIGLRVLTGELVDLSDPALHPRKVERLAAWMSRFRNELWWQHLTEHGVANDLLVAYHRQHRLPELVEQVRSELSDYTQQASLRAGRLLNVVAAFFALFSMLATGVEVYRLIRVDGVVPGPRLIVTVLTTLGVLALVTISAASGRPLRSRRGRRRAG